MSWTRMDYTIGRCVIGDRGHRVDVRRTASNDRARPFRAYCTCGWLSSMHASLDAAQALGDDHVKHPDRRLPGPLYTIR